VSISPYRAGPWPGITPRGGVVLVGCALLLACGQFLVGTPRRAWPDLLLLAMTAFVPLAVATRVVKAPGAASAVCGAYLLPRTLVSLIEPGIEPPPLLLVPAFAYDLAVWLRVSDVWPIGKNAWRRRDRKSRRITPWRAVLGGAIFGLVLSLIAPPFALLLGANAANWTGAALWAAPMGSAVGCALIGFTARGTGS
jgi:hypothetical protein